MTTRTSQFLTTKTALAVCCLLALSFESAAQELPTAKPEDVGVSSEKVEMLASFMQSLVENGKIAGGVTMMARHGKVIHLEAVGMADREQKKPMRTDSIFRIASMTKPITSVAVMMLYEKGKLDLDDPVSKYVPEFKNPEVLVGVNPLKTEAAKREITIRHLLTHTSGLGYEFTDKIGPLYHEHGVHCGFCTVEVTLEQMMKNLGPLPLSFNPGDDWQYGMNNAVLGRVVEVAAGMRFNCYVEQEICRPLGMTDTFFRISSEKFPRLVTAYMPASDSIRRLKDGEKLMWNLGTGSILMSSDYPYSDANKCVLGGGNLCSTAPDYMRFCQMLLNGGELEGTRLLRPDTVKTMVVNQVGDLREEGGWGYGFGVTPDSEDVHEQLRTSYHWAGGWSTSFRISPKGDWAIVTMSQLAWNESTPKWFAEYDRIAAEAIQE